MQSVQQYVDQAAPLVARLCERWLDEAGYEDIKEYGSVIQKSMPVGYALVSMTKRPFGYVFTNDEGKFQIKCAVSKTRISINVYKLN